MTPFKFPGSLTDDAAPAVDIVAIDDREHALDCVADFADLLFGDIVLVPFVDGKPDWENTTRGALEKFAGHWTELEPEDLPRLGVLTDSFARFLADDTNEVSIVTLWRGGTPEVRQIGGGTWAGILARRLVEDALIDDEPLPLRPVDKDEPLEAPKEPPKAANDNKSLKKISATPFSLRDPATLPQREWLYGAHYIRRYLTATAGAGGGGKSAHAVSEALAMVTGRPLLDPDGPLTKPIRVWYVNAEDPQDEIDRRFHAAAKHFNVTAPQIGSRLFTDSGREQEFVIMKQDGRNFKICQPLIEELVVEIQLRQIDVLIVDPFVSTHEVPENDNGAMQRVAKAWTEVADRANCSVEVVHHVVKNSGEVTADSARGGGALKDKTRGMRVINAMTEVEASKAGLAGADGYFRVDSGKVNLVASGRSAWRRFVSVLLGNGGMLSQGDSIGVVAPWRWPSKDAMEEIATTARQAIVADVPANTLAGLKVRLDAASYKADPKGKPWAGDVIMELTGVTDRKDAKAMLDAWVEIGELEVVEQYDATARKPRNFIKPVSAPT